MTITPTGRCYRCQSPKYLPLFSGPARVATIRPMAKASLIATTPSTRGVKALILRRAYAQFEHLGVAEFPIAFAFYHHASDRCTALGKRGLKAEDFMAASQR